MGSYATLGIGNLEVAWSKNCLDDYSDLFLASDASSAPYHYVHDDGTPLVVAKEAYCRPLRRMLERLELMRYNLQSIARVHEDAEQPDLLLGCLLSLDLAAERPARAPFDDLEHTFATEIYEHLETTVPHMLARRGDELREMFQALGPHMTLRLLAEKEANLDLPVVWRFASLVDGGWVKRSDVYRPSAPGARFLVVTEGSSDSLVIQKALQLRRPDIADFFYFVDMKENYPFTGTGSLFNFTKGLARIHIRNTVIVVYDNDAEGAAKVAATEKLELPRNIRAITLPHLPEFVAFPTIGPQGEAVADINGRAASIECYLDLGWGDAGRPPPMVRWTSYAESSGTYQGALVGKDAYWKRFLEARNLTGYDFSKIDALLEKLTMTARSFVE